MDKKIISFFLASSITDLEYDRLSIGDFISQLNNIYMQQNLYIRLYKCENETMNHAIVVDGTQKSLDELIRESDLCFVLFWKKVGEFTLHEFEVAVESFKSHNRPKVVVYFKTLPEGESISKEISGVMDMIDNGLLHYHREYTHIDSLKLGIITQLQVHGFVSNPMKVDNDNVMVGNSAILPTDNIPLFSENDEYVEMVENYNELKAECQALQEQFRLHPTDIQVYRKLKKTIKECERAKEDVDELSDNILKIGNRIATLTMGEALTDKIRDAIACFDRGDYLGVLNILDLNDIEDSIAQLDDLEAEIQQKRMCVVEEYRLRIAALKVLGKIKEIYETYEKAVEQVVDRANMSKDVMFEYVQFLFEQKNMQKALEICNKLLNFYESNNLIGQENEKAKVYNLLAILYFETDDCVKSEEFHKKALEIRRELAAEDDFYQADVAESCNNLAKLYYALNRHKETESLYLEAVEIYQELAGIIDAYEVNVADTLMNLAKLYYQVNYHEQADKTYEIALDKFRSLAKVDPHKYNVYVARACDKLAFLRNAINYHAKADLLYVESLKVKRELAQTSSTVFYDKLVDYCNCLSSMFLRFGVAEYADSFAADAVEVSKNLAGNVYEKTEADDVSFNGDLSFYERRYPYDEIEELSKESIAVYRQLSSANPEAYDDEMANSLSNLAYLYYQQGKFGEAEALYKEVIDKYGMLAEVNPSVMKRELACAYRNAAELYSVQGNSDKSIELYSDAINIYEELSQTPGKFDNDLAKAHKGIAKAYAVIGKNDEAAEHFYRAAKLYVKLYVESPKAYIDRVVNIMADISKFMFPHEDVKELIC